MIARSSLLLVLFLRDLAGDIKKEDQEKEELRKRDE
jgi:hypothetical protein